MHPFPADVSQLDCWLAATWISTTSSTPRKAKPATSKPRVIITLWGGAGCLVLCFLRLFAVS